MNEDDKRFMLQAIELAIEGVRAGDGGPFGCVVVKDGEVIGRGNNRVTSANDPTAHAEIVAIRDACGRLGSFQLEGCTIYTSCEPCPMCLGAIYWSRPKAIFFAGTRDDAAAAGFDDALFYSEMDKPNDERVLQMKALCRDEAKAAFRAWTDKADKTEY
ncbi:MAG: nucleoside deaminase [Chloracidobacterium sp.]|nr:nucleoside deaminase [Chloracidobacterium sp.]MCC6825858.1 nucleoside deaminase [Acidobacteriota bacterium]